MATADSSNLNKINEVLAISLVCEKQKVDKKCTSPIVQLSTSPIVPIVLFIIKNISLKLHYFYFLRKMSVLALPNIEMR